MAGLGSLVVDLSADTAKFQSDLGRASYIAGKAMDQIKSAAASAGLALGALLSVGGSIQFVKSAIDAADALNKMSQKVGVSVEQLSTLQYAAQLSDVSLENLQQGLKKLSVNMLETASGGGNAAAAFKALGIAVQNSDGSLRASDKVLLDVAQRFEAMEDGAGKTALAVRLFGKSGEELIPFLNQGASGIDNLTREAERLGLKLSTETARAAEEFNDNLTRLSRGSQALGIALTKNLIGALGGIAQQLAQAAQEGRLFVQVFKEIEKVAAATISTVASAVGITAFEEKTTALFASNAAAQPGGTGAAAGTKNAAPKPVDEAALKRAADAAKKAQQEFLDLLAKAASKRLELEDKAAEDVEKREAELNDLLAKGALKRLEDQEKAEADFNERALKQEQDFNELLAKAALKRIEMEDQAEEELARKRERDAKKAEEAFRSLGLTMSSAFEKAVVEGQKLSDVLKSLGRDIAQIILRKTVTEPIGEAVLNFVKPKEGGASASSGGLIDWVGKFFGFKSYDVGTDYVPHDMLAVVHQGEAIIPAGQNRGGLGDVYIDARGADSAALARVQQQIAALGGRVQTMPMEIMDRMQRGGSYSRGARGR